MGAGGPMTEAMYYILLTLSVPSHGYQLMSAVTKASWGRVRMGPGTLYGVLTRMESEKMIEIVSDDGRRKTYAITESGRAALRAETDRLRAMLDDQERWEEERKCLTKSKTLRKLND
ncbi:putative PadR family transcriptional regulator [Oscillibacter valericigenes Sjm18-20]|nr:putative PadR family transcriptional regulator [Oscillibacter valericigenes Sjm18-20]